MATAIRTKVGQNPTVEAVHHIRRMRGGAQSQLMRCSDGQYYVVKFRNNPQHSRVLVNDMLATILAEQIGLPVPKTAIVQVDKSLIRETPELSIQQAHTSVPCEAGFQFGSRYVVDPLRGQVFDYLPSEMLAMVRNLQSFAGILVFDKWMGNVDLRQAAFWRLCTERKYRAAFIDQGYCFNAGEWTFPDYPLRGVYGHMEVYETVHGWESFEPWLWRIEHFDEDCLWCAAREIPAEWYDNEWSELERLVEKLIYRRGMIRDLVDGFRLSTRHPFPHWKQ